jgi:FlaG/FlaF family flagellin (archaellin)
MSLRSFHLLFIALSVILTAFFAAWAAGQYRVEHQSGYVVAAAVSLAAGAGLAVYGAAFQRKTRQMR